MTDNEMPPQCRAELYVSRYNDHYRCVRPENHAGRHQDDDNDTWDITYVDEPPAPTGLGSVEISDLSRRVTALEAAWTVGGETLSERLDRVVMGAMEQIRASAQGTERRSDSLERMFMALREDATRMHTRLTGLEARMNPRECHGEQCVKPTVLATQVDGRQLMSDGSVRDPAEPGPAC